MLKITIALGAFAAAAHGLMIAEHEDSMKREHLEAARAEREGLTNIEDGSGPGESGKCTQCRLRGMAFGADC